MKNLFEFSPNQFNKSTESTENLKLLFPVKETSTRNAQVTEKILKEIKANSCFSDLSGFLNLLNYFPFKEN